MRSLRPMAWTVVAMSIAAGLLVSHADAPAGAVTSEPLAPSRELPLALVSDAVIDSAHDQLFVSSRHEGRVVVVDLTTGDTTRLPYLGGASQLTLDETGEYVWVSLETEAAVARISTSAPFNVEQFPLGYTCPGEIVAVGSLVYAAVGACSGQWHELVRLDPSTGEARLSDAAPIWTLYNPVLRPIPGTSHFHWQSRGITGSPSGIVDAATDTVVASTQGSVTYAVMPNGDALLTDDGTLLSTEDLSVRGMVTMPAIFGMDLDRASVSDDNLLAFPVADTLVVHDLVSGQTVNTWRASADAHATVGQTLWDGDRLLGLAGDHPVRLVDVRDARATVTSVLDVDDLDSNTAIRLGSELTVSGTLVDNHGLPLVGAEIQVAGSEYRGRATTDAEGGWTLTAVADTYELRVHFAGDAEHAPVAAFLRLPIGTLQPFLSVEGPTDAAPGTTLEYSGRVVAEDGTPLPGLDVNLDWRCGDMGFEGTVVTADDGTFTYETTAPRCRNVVVDFYVDGYYGGWGRSGAAATSTDISWRVAALQANGPAHLVPGETGTWTVELSIEGVPQPREVILVTSEEGSVRESVTLTTDLDGSATLTSDAIGTHTRVVLFRYAGDSTTLGATATVGTAVGQWESTMTVVPSSTQPIAGQPLVFAGHLALGDGSNPEGYVVQAVDDIGTPLATSVVDADGSFELVERPSWGLETWTFRFAGDHRHRFDQVVVRLMVEAQQATISTARAETSTPRRPAFLTTVDPGHAGMCLLPRWERRTADGWRAVRRSTCRPTEQGGVARFRSPRDLPHGAYRVRARFMGDEYTAAATGGWRRFRIG